MAKSTKSTNVQVNLELSIPQKDYEVFEEVAPGEVGEYLSTCVANYLSAYADGGLMLSGKDVVEISQLTGDDVTSSEDIVGFIKAGIPEDDGMDTFKVIIDPAITTNIREMADFQGVSVEHFLTNCWSHIITNGWLYNISGDTRWIPFSNAQLKEISEASGVDVKTSIDVVNAITAHSGVAV